MLNCNPATSIRYGTIYCNSLDPDVVNELFYGPGAVDLSYLEALKEVRREAEDEADDIEYQATLDIPAGEVGKVEAAIEAAYNRLRYNDRDDFVDGKVERAAEWGIEIEEPEIEGEYKGVKYRISWLGGAPLVWIVEGPLGYANRLCSPCVPNAADLDGGFVHGNSDDPQKTLTEGYLCYVVPADWLRQEGP